ncbi:MAG: hypothetical protein CMJ59_14305 [Planctomycetaceae bacterium]|nr:hypothetical protein [Planctomycetaceae bacterium]
MCHGGFSTTVNLLRALILTAGLFSGGAARIQSAIHLDAWQARTGKCPLLLAWPAAPCGPALRNLIHTHALRGTVACSVARSVAFATTTPRWAATAQMVVNRANSASVCRSYHVGYRRRVFLQEHLCPLNRPAFCPIEPVRHGLRPPGRVGTLEPNAFMHSWYTDRALQVWVAEPIYHSEDLRNQFIGLYRNITPYQSLIGFRDFEHWLLQNRGVIRISEGRNGRLIRVQPPSSVAVIEFERREYPRGQSWGRLRQETGCRGIHFEDNGVLKHYTWPQDYTSRVPTRSTSPGVSWTRDPDVAEQATL